MYGRWLRNSFIYLLILVAIVAIVFTVFQSGGDSSKTEPTVYRQIQAGEVENIEVDNAKMKYKLKDDELKYRRSWRRATPSEQS